MWLKKGKRRTAPGDDRMLTYMSAVVDGLWGKKKGQLEHIKASISKPKASSLPQPAICIPSAANSLAILLPFARLHHGQISGAAAYLTLKALPHYH